ncbi:MAG: aminodeoxychorismate/anthranilate synthase component II [Bacteroidota bacterium]|nr:aminodeoxychorismate/anthranilate synthase component II [Bacteroidota bacterium]MDP4232241.1 aminodeoxychorismate/anthranilate synthase component II [Bacteroidota bacterium]MDP4243580.1 aminodeoxychorismate/anthranilate synthase component II [Bacteroidota bacterium]MDP4289115.1 aminodeoxychorismate/anthranilate synthase component II [Bacteroidota bacterium]
MSQVLLVDNRDSFTHNLAQIIRENARCECTIVAHHNIGSVEIGRFDKIILSPGPGLPREFPELFDLLKAYAASKPILGVCLGMQAIAEFFGGSLYNLPMPRHGRRVKIMREQDDILFERASAETFVGLYHSWAVDRASLPDDLEVTASGPDGVVMALRHKHLDIRGVQFHPESYMTEHGIAMLQNWLAS